MEQHWYTDIFRSIFAAIDGIVYNLISDAYGLLEKIAQVKVFGNDDISSITNKVYTIIGIFMLFKLTFSFITYIVNPDAMTDKDKGVQKIIQNIVIMFAMLIMCPWVFDKLWGLQTVMLKENIVGNFIFGTDDSEKLNGYKFGVDCKEDSTPASVGDYIALMSLKGFYQPYNKSSMGSDMWDKVESSSNFATVNDNLCYKVSKGKVSYYLNSNIYNKAVRISGFGPWGNDVYIMNYRFGISTAVGVVVLLILVGFCMDVGLRVVKLSFLEIIAPIPIVSYVDPKSSKNGIFKKWLKEVGSTWASVFIRLFALFFAVSVIQKVGHLEDAVTGETVTNTWVNLFVIIGALMFAKQLPKLITDITGINLNGGFNLNPLKKVANQALGGKFVVGAATGVAAGGLALAGGAAANAWAAHNKNAKIKKSLSEKGIYESNPNYKSEFKAAGGKTAFGYARTMTAGGFSSAGRAIKAGKDGKFTPIKNATSGVTQSSKARSLRDKGYGLDDKVKDWVTDVADIKFSTGTSSHLKNEVNKLQQELANYRRNEQTMTQALNDAITSDSNYIADLLNVFDGAAKYDARGNLVSYETKTYEQYAERAARAMAVSNGEDWDNLSEPQRSRYVDWAESNGDIVDRNKFNAYNDLYNARNQADLGGRKTEQKINEYNNDMDKFKNRKK